MADNTSGDGQLTLAGRFNHYSTKYLGTAARFYARLHARLYDRFGGTRFTTLSGKPVFRLIVTGRKSGEPRPVMLMLVRDGEDLLVCGSNGGHPDLPNWWRNLVTTPRPEVQVGPDRWAVEVHVVDDDAEYERLWKLLVAGYQEFATYRALSERRFPIAVLRKAS